MTKDQIPQMQLVEAKKPRRKNRRPLLNSGEVDKILIENEELRTQKVEPSVALMLQGLLESVQKGETTPQTVEVLKGMMDLYERDQAKTAERAFNAAFVKLQQELPIVEADKSVMGKNGVLMYRYATAAEIHTQIQPCLIANGFAVRSTQRMDQDRVTAVSTLMHISGHSASSEFTARSGQGAPGMNETKCDQSASTVAEREALCNLLNIARSSRQDDAKMIGQPIGKALGQDLATRLIMVGADREAFLKYAGAKDFNEISDERWPVLDELLKRKEAAKVAREKLSPEGEQWK